MQRLVLRFSVLIAFISSFLIVFPASPAHAASSVGSFEIDGNLADSAPGEPIDWDTPPPNLTTYADLTDANDTSFGPNSVEQSPGTWSCGTSDVPGKDDIASGQLAHRFVGGKEYLYLNVTRQAADGDAHVDWELNQTTANNPACPVLPQRTDGDIVVTFDTAGSAITVRVFRWAFTGPGVGTFTQVAIGAFGTNVDAAINIPNTMSGHVNGDFGEIALNVSDTIGPLCGTFVSTHMQTRAGTPIDSAVLDHSQREQLKIGGCPVSLPTKAVRNVTTGSAFATSTNASPGDVLEYRINYVNGGTGPATNLVITDAIQPRQTFLSCSNGCSTPPGSVSWTFANVPAASSQQVTFQVTLDSAFPSGVTTVSNQASVDTNEENPKTSNTTAVSVTASEVLTSVKTVAPGTAAVGGTVAYTVKVTNSGNANAVTNVTDDYDQSHITVSNISNGGADNGNTITWSNLAVAAHSTVTLTYSGTVIGVFSGQPGPNCATGQYPVPNTVTVSGGTGADATLCVTATPMLATTKTVNPGSTSVGGTVTYTVTVANSGAADASTTVTDDYDQTHLTVSNISGGGVDNANTITWTNVSVAAGQSVSFTYSGTAKGTFSGSSGGGGCATGQYPVVNTVTITGGTGDDATLCVNAAPALTVDKTVSPATATIGQTVSYKVVVTNSGSADGTTNVVDDYDQAHVTVGSISGGGADNGDTITWTSVMVPAGQSVTLTYSGTTKGSFTGPSGGGGCHAGEFPVVNLVTITGDTDSATLCVAAAPVLTTDKSVSPTATNVGGSVTYTVKVTNSGTAGATTTVTDDYDQTHIAVSNISGGGVNNNNTIVWSNVSVPAGQSVTFTYTGTVIGTFSGSSGGGGCNPGQFPVLNTATITGGTGDDATLCVNASPVLTTDKTVSPTTANVGGAVTYTVKVTNSGTAGATTTVTDDYDQSHITVSNVSGGGVDNANTITWSNVSVPAGQSVTFTYTGTVIGTFSGSSGGGGCASGQFPVLNTATITGGTGDDATLCVNASPVLTTDKTVSPTTANPGQQVAYKIVITNSGKAAGITTATDDFDESHISVSNISNGGTSNGNTITWNNLAVPAGGTVTLTYTGTVIGSYTGTPPAGCGTNEFPVVNSVTITGGTGDTNTLCVSTATTLTVSKTACPNVVVPGGLVTYTITYSNTGANPANNVTVVDTIPNGTQVADAGGGTVNGNQVTWNAGTVNGGQGGTRTLVLLVTAANGASLVNTVSVSASNAPTAQGTTTTNVSNAGAITHGSAYGLDVDLVGIPLIDELNKVSTVAPGSPQTASKSTAVIGVVGVVSANVVRQTSNSAVTDEAVSTSTSEVAALNLLSGAITADVIRGVSESVATPTSASSNSAGSTFANLRINGAPITNVQPNTSIAVKNPLPLLGGQTIASAVLYEEVKSAKFVNGKFTATHTVNMLHVTLLKGFLTLPAGTEIIVAHADSDATYPSGLACGTAPSTVSGEAFAAFAQGTFLGNPLVATKVGDAVITPLGGSASDTIAGVLIPGAAASGTAVDTTSGSITPNPTATARSKVNGTNVLGGLVTADLLDVSSTSNANGATAGTTFATTFTNLKVNNVTINAQVAPNSTISVPQGGGIVLVILNEQIVGGNGTRDTEGTVNAVHVYVLNGSGLVTAEVIVASAHSDAHK